MIVHRPFLRGFEQSILSIKNGCFLVNVKNPNKNEITRLKTKMQYGYGERCKKGSIYDRGYSRHNFERVSIID